MRGPWVPDGFLDLNHPNEARCAYSPQVRRKSKFLPAKSLMDRYYSPDLKKIEAILLQKGWAVADLARKGILSQRTIDSIMAGGRVYRSTLRKLATLLGVKNPVHLLLGEKGYCA